LDDTVFDATQAWAAQSRQRNIGDFTQWETQKEYKKAFDRLLRELTENDFLNSNTP